MLKTYRVYHDFRKFQPKWAGDYPRWFGVKNEGTIVEANTEAEAKERAYPTLNPFYLATEEVTDVS